jgi:hypothetical protein
MKKTIKRGNTPFISFARGAKDVRRKHEKMEIILDFAQADLNLDVANRSDLEGILNNLGSFAKIQLGEGLRESDKTAILELQKKWRGFLDWIWDHLENAWRIEFDRPWVFEWGETEKSPFTHGPLIHGDTNEIQVRAINLTSDSQQPLPPETLNFPPGWLEFIDSLYGSPKRSLSRCGVCGKLFFNVTRRKKKFCSRRCQNTSAAREFRNRVTLNAKLPAFRGGGRASTKREDE